MIENEFRRIALAQGLLPAVPAVPAVTRDDDDPVAPRNPGAILKPGAPADNPAMVEQHAPNA